VRLSRILYRAARTERDLEATESGDPKRIARRAKNKVVGRLVWRAIGRMFR